MRSAIGTCLGDHDLLEVKSQLTELLCSCRRQCNPRESGDQCVIRCPAKIDAGIIIVNQSSKYSG